METIEDLQSLLEQIEQQNKDASVFIYLPAVRYEGGLRITERAVELIGTTDGSSQTTFTGSMIVKSNMPQINIFRNLVLEGNGGVGVYNSARLILYDCTVRNWDIGVYVQDGGWAGVHQCVFEQNKTALQFDSREAEMADPDYINNVFRDNGTAISLIHVPGEIALTFPDTVFSGNEIDIDNPAGHPVNTQDAVFESNAS